MKEFASPSIASDLVPAPAAARAGTGWLPAQHSLAGITISPAPFALQTSLEIGAPDDPLEREADDVADAVMRMPEGETLQRKCAGCEEDDSLQRMGNEDEEEDQLQPKSLPGAAPVPAVSDQVQSARQGGEPLPSSARAWFEPRFGHDFSQVRVHTGPAAAQAASAVHARAFTLGSDVVLGAGQPSIDSSAGRELMAHELTHVIQQGHAPPEQEPE